MNVYTRLPVATTPPPNRRGGRVWVRSDCLRPLLDAGFELYEHFETPPRAVETIAESRTTRTVRLDVPGIGPVYLKHYQYDTWGSRWRGALRNTGPRRSRAHREWRSLRFLERAGIGCVEPIAVGEARSFGFVRSCVLLTREATGFRPIDSILAAQGASEIARQLGADLADYVRRLHQTGFVDGNLRLRNLLARETPHGFEILSLDSPKGKRIHILRGRRQERDLASLDRDARGYASRAERLRAYLAYRGVEGARAEKPRLERIVRLSDRYARREPRSRFDRRPRGRQT